MRINFLFLLFLLFLSCKPSFDEPNISLINYQIEENFELSVIASEPLLTAPVAIDFDNRGRIWVVEMPGFMNSLDGEGENEPNGTIKILEDFDNDGVMDHAKIFLDSLVLPRAIAMAYDGILYSEPPNLWFAEIENDKPVNRVLVDSLYATDGNPEHQPNGLMMNIDNWIYNAKSHFRYQRKNGKWLKEPTTFRGQWGITHDNLGRLYYNDNSRQLLGDYILPNRAIRNKFQTPKHSVNQLLTNDQRVYPLHDAVVNRGYAKGVLDSDSLLVNVTAACGPLFYRGGSFPLEYKNEVFVCVPEANLVKRNTLEFHGDSTSAKQTWQGKEFLASTDEGFRPVSLNNAPDGSIYVVDMHRGVIGHHAYLSPYMREKVKERELDTLISAGRILRIKNKPTPSNMNVDFDDMSEVELLESLKHKNGWIRDRAQHLIVSRNLILLKDELEELSMGITAPLTQIHALRTLEGLNELSFELLVKVADNSNADVISHVVVLLEDFVLEDNIATIQELLTNWIEKKDKQLDLYVVSSLGKWVTVSSEMFMPMVIEIAKRYPNSKIFNELILSGFDGVENLVNKMEEDPQLFNESLLSKIDVVGVHEKEDTANWIFTRKSLVEDTRTKGAKLFRQICTACHGMNGEGLEGLAPPLMNSEYASKPIERMGLIILHGLEGPVHVNGKEYNLNLAMPGLINNEKISDKDIADIISYVSNAFSDTPQQLKEGKVAELRKIKSKSGAEFTEKELLEY
ncbi:c-type cytochrome [Maribacter sp. HTCC2170]|uniref:DUF7133 domain-containing protein n=1 Tax=Maribacter sp. (strain HTCC2170 / KCCM 42371) TaxID=313603 RepID=UPI00006B49CE|nr:c-type cytochrome [Maribacter sp. HTCC2170]EAR00900.1 hypothetical protein FB2170_09021 [Maribacter sp. HTCC2170]